uniref:Uncharacterized protein n=1 Tax=Nelumbo nucifera TaxID=4432 RepID=A0A822Z6H0_NELNU|nr:TPA_asm: hypothetical protein HUJ06_014553 [Nelumbo nucifera]
MLHYVSATTVYGKLHREDLLFGGPVYTLRGPRASAFHFGTCGLHLGQEEKAACFNNGSVNIVLEKADKIVNINSDWEIHLVKHKTLHQPGFMGWGGWGDVRDHQLCLDFAEMYHSGNNPKP